ncbi:MAG: [Fe-Fe] hydrogenase large subunit C-terminal domain-containing protein [Bacteroidales bacterium]|nr:[Fe-Fe] hydrogenase large subunit C-terminal domain-containing protein [Bacteroidales bacterium]
MVFIGPCLAKRKEVRDNPDIDWTMTFEELACLFNGWEIPVLECEESALDPEIDQLSRNYCQSGGASEALLKKCESDTTSLIINGLDSKQLKTLSAMAKKGASEGQLVEVMSCEGGCLSGPCNHEFPKDAKRFYGRNMGGLK